MNNNYKAVEVGTIDLSDISIISEMSPGNVGLSGKLGLCKLEVYPNEGQIPHFHIISKNNIKWECCIEIYNPKYFSYGSKIGKLTNKQLKILDSWLRDISKKDIFSFGVTNWQTICMIWEFQGNPNTNVPKNPIQPDYTKIN